jgi:hypothetical protein
MNAPVHLVLPCSPRLRVALKRVWMREGLR